LSRGLRVDVLGPVVVRQDGAPVPVPSGKALELLCYLVLHGDRAHSRDALAGLLWPDAAAAAGRKYLRQALWQLRATLGDGAGSALGVRADRVRMGPEGSWESDVRALERAHRGVRAAAPGALPDDGAAALAHAVALHRGPLLEGWDHEWCARERDRLAAVHLELRERLVDHHLARGALAEGRTEAERLLALDPAREATHRRLMRLHAAAGDRTAALRQYRRCVEVLTSEFGVGPAPETIALHRQLRGDGPADAPSEVERTALRRLDARLDTIAAAVAALHRDVTVLLDLQAGVARLPAPRDEHGVPRRPPVVARAPGDDGDREAG
jgi:DNA-binding SARP family transcriptional activator